MSKKQLLSFFLFSLIFILAFFLRAQETISGNFLFLLDQGRDLMDVKSIVFDHHLTLIGPYTSLQGIFQGPLFYYLLAIPAFITQGDPWGVVALMLLISMSVLIVSFVVMQRFFGWQAALVTSFLLAFSPEAIAAATYAWNPHPMWLLISLFLFSFYQLVLGKQKYHLLVWPVVALMFHFEAALGFFIFLAGIMHVLIFERKTVLSRYFLYGMLLFFIFFLPQILFDLRHDFLMSGSFLSLFYGKNQGLITGSEHQSYLSVLNDHLTSFVINFNSIFQQSTFLPHLPLFIFLLCVFLFIVGKQRNLLHKKESRFIMMHIQLAGIIFLLTSLYPFPIRYWFLTGFQLFYILPMGLLLGMSLRYTAGKVVALLFVFLTLLTVIPKLYTLYSYPDYGGVAKIKGKIAALDYIYTDAKGEKFGLLVFTPPVHTDAYDYLIWWYGEKTYHYIPHSEKKGTVYLLMEPDPSKPWSYKGWLETVIKTGEIVSTRKLPSGHIVQKRIVTMPSAYNNK